MVIKHAAGRPGNSGTITAGDVIGARELTTIRSERILVPDPGMVTHLQFRRFAGCPLCNLHLRAIARRHGELAAAGIREVAVFHSSAEDMLPHQGQLPFAVIADPGRKLYREFGVTTSPRALLHPRAWTAPLNPQVYPMVARALRAGGSPAPRHGDSVLGLPADFLIAPGGRVLAAKYGQHASDHWPVDELLRIAGASTSG
jgi:peroxiredoxin